MTIKIGVCGVAGRMGREILNVIADDPEIELKAAIENPDSQFIGIQVSKLLARDSMAEILISADVKTCAEDVDVVIDFSIADAVRRNLDSYLSMGCKLVLGTTGLDMEMKNQLNQMAQRVAIVLAPNMSVGVNLCFRLLEMAAAVLGTDTDIEIIESHHNQKKDAPSGTALKMGEILAAAKGGTLEDYAVYDRSNLQEKRASDTIGFSTIRAGDIVGTHTVLFASPGEQIEITHRASSRKSFAVGAIRAAKWLMNKESGLFDMQDVLQQNMTK